MNQVIYIAVLSLLAPLAQGEVSHTRMAVRQLAERARSGDAKSLCDLAILHDMGYDSIPVDSARSTALYRLSAEKGYAPAQNYLGFRYFKGEGVTQNVDSALYWITEAAENGDAKAANNLGFLFSQGEKIPVDYPKAIHWLSVAADAGVPTGQSLLADLYREGKGVKPDTLHAVSLYTKAIAGGLQDAEKKLLAMVGESWLTLPLDTLMKTATYYYNHRAPVIGVTLLTKAAEEGDAEAMAMLGDAYAQARGVDYSYEKSLEWYRKAAKAGNPRARKIISELREFFPDL